MFSQNSRVRIVLLFFFTAFLDATGQPTVSLNWLSLYCALEPPVSQGPEIKMSRGADSIRFLGNSRRMEFNGVMVWLSGPVHKRHGRWRISKSDVDNTVIPLLHPERFLSREGSAVVVLDAGHGGNDRGVVYKPYGLEEKNITLRLARGAADILRDERITVYLTRTEDYELNLEERCELAAGFGADLFVSIHINAAANEKAAGIETHIMPTAGSPITANPGPVSERDHTVFPGNNHDGANVILGYMLQRSLLEHSGGADRGIRRSRFHVIRNAAYPAALIECGFLSNPDQAAEFLDPAYCDRMARAIAEGVLLYLEAVRTAFFSTRL